MSGQPGNDKFRRLAQAAIARLEAGTAPTDDVVLVAESAKNARPFAHLEFRARIGYASDDNVFRTPDQDYVDFAADGQPLITPEPVTGNYVPLSLSAKYVVNSLPFEGFYGAYRFAGRPLLRR